MSYTNFKPLNFRVGFLCAALTMVAPLCALAEVTTTVLHSFEGSPGDGSISRSGLVADAAGNLYGAVASGGAYGRGVVFKLSPDGVETLLYSFTGGSDGSSPYYGSLVLDSAGNLYGTTNSGGASNYGVVFKLAPGGAETVLHSFSGPDGRYSSAGLTADSAGNLYGVTYSGGAFDKGVIYKLTLDGTFTVLHSFAGGVADGANADTGVTVTSDGNIYGTTIMSGASDQGVLFRLSPDGTFTVLHSFPDSGTDGVYPKSPLTSDSAGNLYGTTSGGGPASGGTVFKVAPDGTYSTLYAFQGGPADGQLPSGALVVDDGGYLYGATALGGASGVGTVYRLSPTGTETVLHSFSTTDGKYAFGGVIADAAGNLYGMTENGGVLGLGVVYKVSGGRPTDQTITFTGLPATATLDAAGPYTLNATASSGLPVSYTVTGPATLSGATLTVTGAGTLVVTASQAGDITYNPAAPVSLTMVVSPASQTITFTGLPATATFGAAGPYTLNATASSGLPVSYTVTGPATLSGATLAVTGVGTVVVTASQDGNATYNPAAPVSLAMVVSPASQTITFGTIAAQTVGAQVSLSASASSGLAVSYVSSTLTVCTVSGSTATMIAAGTCTIQASQPGNANYNPATPVTQSFNVTSAADFTITPLPPVQNVVLGNLTGFVLQLQSVQKFNGNVTLSCSGGPAGTKCANLPQTVRVNGTALAVSGILIPKGTPKGTYTMSFTGVSGSLKHTTTAQFIVK
jgi:uncharacterized repeat protein (TIGR03803 family)